MNRTFDELKSDLRDLLPENYIPLLVTYTREDAEINGLRKAKKTDTAHRVPEYFSALEALDRSKKIVLVGEKGMGKSSFLRMLALCMAGESSGDREFNIARLTEPVIRSETGSVPETQVWNAGCLHACFIDLEADPSVRFPDSGSEYQLLLIDGIETLSQDSWIQVSEQIQSWADADPNLYVAAVCDADIMNRLRPRLDGFTTYTVQPLIEPLKIRVSGLSSDALHNAESVLSAPLREVLRASQNYIRWVQSGCKARKLSDFFDVSASGQKTKDARQHAYSFLAGNPDRETTGSIWKKIDFSDAMIKYHACQYCIENDFGKSFRTLIDHSGYESWSILRMMRRIITEESGKDHLTEIAALCPSAAPRKDNEPDALAALFSAELAFSVRDSMAGYDDFLSHLRQWMKAIVRNGWLNVYDRIEAGKRLSWLGDDRELDELAEIPGGTYMMGDYLIPNNQPVTEVRVEPFKMGVYPVTNQLYAEFIQETGSPWLSDEADDCERRNYPATNLTWFEAVKFCDWLTEKWRGSGKIEENEFVRLPTEAEWEYAAHGRHSAEPGKMIFAWGSDWVDDNANTAELGLNDTCSVGLFPGNVSDFGIRDMNGMIWEWNTTVWGPEPKSPDYPYPYDASDGREKSRFAPDEARRVMRGGSFGSTADHATATYRGHLEPIGFWRGDGFRIVVSTKKHE